MNSTSLQRRNDKFQVIKKKKIARKSQNDFIESKNEDDEDVDIRTFIKLCTCFKGSCEYIVNYSCEIYCVR